MTLDSWDVTLPTRLTQRTGRQPAERMRSYTLPVTRVLDSLSRGRDQPRSRETAKDSERGHGSLISSPSWMSCIWLYISRNGYHIFSLFDRAVVGRFTPKLTLRDVDRAKGVHA